MPSDSPALLLVDDYHFIRSIVGKMLIAHGYTNVHEAEDGQEALDKLREQAFALVITDLNMPVLDGIELTKEMRRDENLQHIPVLLISGEENTNATQKAREAGVTESLLKPFTPEQLVKCVGELLEPPA
jgi:two-component system chemotaxis response regulator CheY